MVIRSVFTKEKMVGVALTAIFPYFSAGLFARLCTAVLCAFCLALLFAALTPSSLTTAAISCLQSPSQNARTRYIHNTSRGYQTVPSEWIFGG
jgi:hypothetical protein